MACRISKLGAWLKENETNVKKIEVGPQASPKGCPSDQIMYRGVLRSVPGGKNVYLLIAIVWDSVRYVKLIWQGHVGPGRLQSCSSDGQLGI